MSDIPPGRARPFISPPPPMIERLEPMGAPRTELERRIDIALNPDSLLFSHNPIVTPIDVANAIAKVVLVFVNECVGLHVKSAEASHRPAHEVAAYNAALDDLGKTIGRDEDPPPAPTTYVFDHALKHNGQLRLKVFEKGRHPLTWTTISVDYARELIADGRLEEVTL